MITLMGVGLAGFGAAVHRLPVAEAGRRFRLARSTSARSTTSSSADRAAARTSSTSPRPARGSSSTRRRPCPRPRRSTPAPSSPGWRPAFIALYQKCVAPRLPRAVLRQHRSGSSARATARSTTTSVRRRAVRRRVAWTASPSASAGGNRRHRHRRRVTRPADRHEHHRPGGRGPALHHVGGRALRWSSPASTQSIAIIIFVVLAGVVVWSTSSERAPGRAGGDRLGDRAGPEPQAVLRRRDARGSTASSGSQLIGVCSCWSSARSRCRCTGCTSRLVRPAPWSSYNETFAPGAALDFATTADGGFNCAGCHGGMKATGRQCAAYTVHRSPTPARSRP